MVCYKVTFGLQMSCSFFWKGHCCGVVVLQILYHFIIYKINIKHLKLSPLSTVMQLYAYGMPTTDSIPLPSHLLKCGYLSFVTPMLLKCHTSSI